MSESIEFVSIKSHQDDRGELVSFESGAPLTFEPKRVFSIRNVPPGQYRARHAVSCDEFLILQSGTCRLTIKSLTKQISYDLSDLDTGIFVPAGYWIELSDFSTNALILVLCSQRYEDVEYYNEPQL